MVTTTPLLADEILSVESLTFEAPEYISYPIIPILSVAANHERLTLVAVFAVTTRFGCAVGAYCIIYHFIIPI